MPDPTQTAPKEPSSHTTIRDSNRRVMSQCLSSIMTLWKFFPPAMSSSLLHTDRPGNACTRQHQWSLGNQTDRSKCPLVATKRKRLGGLEHCCGKEDRDRDAAPRGHAMQGGGAHGPGMRGQQYAGKLPLRAAHMSRVRIPTRCEESKG